jgi:hypothetical protein
MQIILEKYLLTNIAIEPHKIIKPTKCMLLVQPKRGYIKINFFFLKRKKNPLEDDEV